MHFDWPGFRFTVMVMAITLVLFSGTSYGAHYLSERFFKFVPESELARPNRNLARVIAAQKIPEVVPSVGKFIAADLSEMKLTLFNNGTNVAEYPILTKGKIGSPWETPAGLYAIESKLGTHYSSIGDVYMPYSMQFYGNYFIHGWPYYPSGKPVEGTYSGGCIRLSTEDAKAVYQFAGAGTGVFVYDSEEKKDTDPLTLGLAVSPRVTATAYLIADIDTGDVYLEKNAKMTLPIASITKLMTALVGNEMISLEREIAVPEGEILHPKVPTNTKMKRFPVGNLFYPLLMESNNKIAESIAANYGRIRFVEQMNMTAMSLGMKNTSFADASGISAGNVSTAEDLYRLAVYLSNKKSFIWGITRAREKTITATDGVKYKFSNYNLFSGDPTFFGGKVGHTIAAADTMLSVFNVNVNGEPRRIAVVVLKSNHNGSDVSQLISWFSRAAKNNLAQAEDYQVISQ